MQERVLFEDNHLIAINKKSGEIVQGDKTGDIPLSETIKAFLKEKYQKPGNVFCGVIHRIDRPVTGIVLFAKTSKGLERMNAQFQQKKIRKTYLCIVRNEPKQTEGIIQAWLKKNEKQNKSYAYNHEEKNALFSELEYKVIGKSDRFFLLEINPITGRHHQIRCLLAHIGCPILGDLKYGDKRPNPDKSISLHAYKLNFTHPTTEEPIEIIAPKPNSAPWSYFSI
ncbi:MAG TPA: RluA family pseudouridine synthase [Bacteroidia bacterium]